MAIALMPENEPKSHKGKKTDTENTDAIVQCVQTQQRLLGSGERR